MLDTDISVSMQKAAKVKLRLQMQQLQVKLAEMCKLFQRRWKITAAECSVAGRQADW